VVLVTALILIILGGVIIFYHIKEKVNVCLIFKDEDKKNDDIRF